ncbi:glutamate--cysteine ligase [Arthrobacter sp. GCM10027362]|uniref:glutamate--cysteine ligase n=1 Tax=Arthrobacter sp. GCM10027362 TaxID=3273379 RepID=UPI0036329AB6
MGSRLVRRADMKEAATHRPPAPYPALPWVFAGIVVLALSLRAPIIAPTAVVGDIQAGTGLSAAGVGLLTGIPVLLFALATPLATWTIRRFGPEATVILCLAGVLAGTVLRSVGPTAVVLAGTVLIGTAITLGNIVVPVIISRDVPWRQAPAATGAFSAATNIGCMAVLLGTPPLAGTSRIVPAERCEALRTRFALTAAEQLTCGFHVHVGIASAAEGVGVLDRIRNWLPVLAALAVNSPFWNGADTGYAGYRTQLWGRWPCTGPLDLLGSADAYRRLVAQLLDTQVPLDEAMLYFDARLSRNHPTVEIRVSDVCLCASDAVLIAALARALVDTAAGRWQAGLPPAPTPTATLRLAMWQASRAGLEGNLLGPDSNRPVPAAEAVAMLLEHVRRSLQAHGDEAAVESLLAGLGTRGTGAAQQRAAAGGTGNLSQAVAEAIRLTHAG